MQSFHFGLIPNVCLHLFWSHHVYRLSTAALNICIVLVSPWITCLIVSLWDSSAFCYYHIKFFLPSLLPVTSSAAPSPMPNPPTPSIALIISL